MAKRERIRISNETLNCYGTWIRTAGVVMEQFKRNPVMLWMHLRGVIIGYVDDVVVKDDDITGVPVFDEASEESKRAKRQWEKGSLRMGSPHFEVLVVATSLLHTDCKRNEQMHFLHFQY